MQFREISAQKLGYVSRVNSILDELLVTTARSLQESKKHNRPQGVQEIIPVYRLIA